MNIKIDGEKYAFDESENLIAQFERNNNAEQDIKEPTELGEVIKDLNNDSINPVSKMSAIDMRTRLYETELGAILGVDTLVSFGFLPRTCLPFTMQKKRLNISLEGQGRKETIAIVSGKSEMDAKKNGGGSFASNLMKGFGGNKPQ